MPRLLNRMPFPAEPGEVLVRGERVRIHANQLVVWVSLGIRKQDGPNPAAIPFLDTGYNHSFAINERQLRAWAGLNPVVLKAHSATQDRGRRIDLRDANIWVHTNVAGQRDRLADVRPHLLEAKKGIAVYPGDDFPRLPLLGLRAIAENALILNVNGPRREATLRTPVRLWPFGD